LTETIQGNDPPVVCGDCLSMQETMTSRLVQVPGRTARRAWLTAAFLVVVCAPIAAQGPASESVSREVKPLEPMAVSQLEQSRSDAPAQTVPRSLQAPKETPQTLRPLTVTQLDERQRDEALDGGRTFSLSFSEPVPISDLLLLLVRDTTLSIVPAPDIQGTFIGELKNVTVRQALELVLPPLGLDFSAQGNFIRVFKRRLETRLFDVNYVVTRRSAQRSRSASSAVGGAGSTTTVSSEESGDVFGELAGGIRTLLSADGRFNLDRKAALLQVTDYPDRLDRIDLYLEAVQMRVWRQVQIQARVIEVELDDQHENGIDWSAVIGSAGPSVNLTQPLARAAGGGVTIGADIRDAEGLLNALATQGKVNVLASPRVVAMNNEPAIMRVGTQDVYFVTTSQVDAATGRVVQTTVTPQPVTEGIVLSVTPQISGDGTVHMSISPSISERTGQVTSRLGDTVPIISVRETDTLVRVRQNETIVISGLTQDRLTRDQSKPTLLGLFRREETARRKTDLVILLTPTIVTPGATLEVAVHDEQRAYEARGAPEQK
jgi:MSHA biogenesis protein MshL